LNFLYHQENEDKLTITKTVMSLFTLSTFIFSILFLISLFNIEIIYAIDENRIERIHVENNPNKLVFNMIDERIYVTQESNTPGNVIILDQEQNPPYNTINIESSSYGIEVYPNNGNLYITREDPRNSTYFVYLVSPSAGGIIERISLDNSPLNIAFNPSNGNMYVTHPAANSLVSVINASTNQVETTIPLGGQSGAYSIAFNPSNGNMYVTNKGSNTVSVIDSNNNQVNKTISVGSNPIDIAFNPSNNNMYVTNQESNTITVIDSTNNEVTYTIPVGNHPSEIIFNPVDKNIYIIDQNANSVYVIDSLTNTVSKIIPLNLEVTEVKDVIYDPIENKMYISIYPNTIVAAQFTPSLLDAVCPLENVQHWNSITFKVTSPELAEILTEQDIGDYAQVIVNSTLQYTTKTSPGFISLPHEKIIGEIFPDSKVYRNIFEKFIKIIDIDYSTICVEEFTKTVRDVNPSNNFNIENTMNEGNIIKLK
jgi:YVTN family beta-propeller protein